MIIMTTSHMDMGIMVMGIMDMDIMGTGIIITATHRPPLKASTRRSWSVSA